MYKNNKYCLLTVSIELLVAPYGCSCSFKNIKFTGTVRASRAKDRRILTKIASDHAIHVRYIERCSDRNRHFRGCLLRFPIDRSIRKLDAILPHTYNPPFDFNIERRIVTIIVPFMGTFKE